MPRRGVSDGSPAVGYSAQAVTRRAKSIGAVEQQGDPIGGGAAPEVTRAGLDHEFDLDAGRRQHIRERLALPERHGVVGVAVREVERRRAAVHVVDGTGRVRGIRNVLHPAAQPAVLAGLAGGVDAERAGVLLHREQVAGAVPVDDPAHPGAGFEADERGERPAR